MKENHICSSDHMYSYCAHIYSVSILTICRCRKNSCPRSTNPSKKMRLFKPCKMRKREGLAIIEVLFGVIIAEVIVELIA